MATAVLNNLVTDAQLARYGTLVYERIGIRIAPQKKTLLSNRLRRRLRANGMKCFDAYYRHLQSLPANDQEWDAFLQEITTHETYLFRDAANWKWFTETYLPEIQKQARRKQREKSLRIWSAACSTGDEVYTLACCLADKLTNAKQWDVQITGTDIGIGALERARQGIFSERAMRLVPETYRRRYFSRVDDERWSVKPVLTRWTKFQQHNLMDPFLGPPFDLILLKNVLIYFDGKSKRRVMENLDQSLRPDGFILTGPADGVSELLRVYARGPFPWLHQKTLSQTQPA